MHKKFCAVQKSLSKEFVTLLIMNWEDLLTVLTVSKINPLCQTCQAVFYSAAALKKKKFLLFHFESQGQPFSWTITA